MSFRVVSSRVRLSKPVAPLSPPLKNLRAGVSLMPVNVVLINSLLHLSPLIILLKSDGGDNLNGGLGPSSTMPTIILLFFLWLKRWPMKARFSLRCSRSVHPYSRSLPGLEMAKLIYAQDLPASRKRKS